MKKRIAVLTSSRADFAHLQWPLRRMQAHPGLDPVLIVTGAHLSDEFGHSVDEITAAGFTVDHRVECLLSSDTDIGMAKTIGVATLALADLLGDMRPDLLLLIADRYEMLAPAAVALALRIPVAHIEGGEISEGAIDDAVRHALTKIAHLHFTPTANARRRVIAMGEERWRVHAVGAPSIDTLVNEKLLPRVALSARLGTDPAADYCVVAVHPVTLHENTLDETEALFAALDTVNEALYFCFPNADAGSRELVKASREICARRDNARVFVNLAPALYWSLLSHSTMLIGNSSSGIMETPALRLPTVNIGTRQQGRQRSANIVDTPARRDAIAAAIETAASPSFRQSLAAMDCAYGDGQAGRRIAGILASMPSRDALLNKRGLPLIETAEGCPAFDCGPDRD